MEKQGAEDLWLVTYRFSEPQEKIVFTRNTNLFRQKLWRLKSPALEIKKEKTYETLNARDGAKFSEAVIELNSYYESLNKDYEFFLPFTDGSQLLYTGHLNVAGPKYFNSSESDLPPTTFHFVSPNSNIYFLGNAYEKSATWNDNTGDGTYVYFGNIQPLETAQFISIIDPGLPAWVKEALFDGIPKLFAYYTELLQQKLKQRPMIYFNYRRDGKGLGSGGGVLPGVVQLRLEGSAWEKKDDEKLERVLFLIGHESAHLWNGDLFQYADEKAYWMHEGSANALSFRASRRLGVYDDIRANEIFSNELNDCIAQVGTNPLNHMSKLGSYGAYYSCGSTIGLLTELAVREKDPTLSLWNFWAALYRNAEKNRYGYNQALYLRTLRELSGANEVAAEIERFVMQGVASPKEFFRTNLERLGVRVHEDAKTGKLAVSGISSLR